MQYPSAGFGERGLGRTGSQRGVSPESGARPKAENSWYPAFWEKYLAR